MASYIQAFFSRAFGISTAEDEKPNFFPTTNPHCRYPLGTETASTFTLPDGRKLSYAQYGSKTGQAILFQHGFPGSRFEGALFDDLGKRLGFRLIAADRPGHGWSTPDPNGTILSRAKDVEQLAEHLELDEYGVLGVSGGGPAALALAYQAPPEKLKAVTIVVGLGPPDIGYAGMKLLNRCGWGFTHRYLPSLSRLWWSRQTLGKLHLSDEQRIELVKAEISNDKHHPKDLAVWTSEGAEDFVRYTVRSNRENFAQGYDAAALDSKLSASDFGFRVEDIRKDLPVRLWYGKYDENVPANHGVQIAKRLGEQAKLRIEDETHLSMFVNYQEEFTKDLLQVMKDAR